MKAVVILLLAFLATTYGRALSSRVNHHAGVSPDKSLDNLLNKIDPYLRQLAYLPPEDLAIAKSIYRIILDFERSKEDRRERIMELFKEMDVSDDEKIAQVQQMNMIFMVTDIFAKKMPLNGKLFFNFALKIITSDKFLFGSHKTRKMMLKEELMEYRRILMGDPKLLEELRNAKDDNEFMLLANKFGWGM